MAAEKLIVIGGSAGSLDALLQIIPALQASPVWAIVIIVHRKNTFDTLLIDLLASKTIIPVKEADDKEMIMPATIYIASADYHLLIEKNKSFSLDLSEKINYSRPSIDVSFQAAAEAFQNNLTGILLSGANNDGVQGLRSVKQHKGVTIVQDPQTADISFMPEQAIEHADIDFILTPQKITEYISSLK